MARVPSLAHELLHAKKKPPKKQKKPLHAKIILKNLCMWSSHRGAVEINLTRNHGVEALIPGLVQWVNDLALLCAVV